MKLQRRLDGEFLIIARSDARGVADVDESIKRYNAYFDAGADFGVIAESYSVEDLRKATGSIKGPLGVAGGIPGRDETLLALEEYERMGIKMVISGLSALDAVSCGVMDVYGHLRNSGIISPSMMSSMN